LQLLHNILQGDCLAKLFFPRWPENMQIPLMTSESFKDWILNLQVVDDYWWIIALRYLPVRIDVRS
jgi:hypothetical protein